MIIDKAVITAAGNKQKNLPLQTLIDRDGMEKSVLQIIIEECIRANISEIGIVIDPENEQAYSKVVSEHKNRIRFIPQINPQGYGHAIFCAKDFVKDESFLHLVGDHLYVSRTEKGCAQHLVEVAKAEDCTISAVHATRETQLRFYGAVGGRREAGKKNLYRIEMVMEKPTPTVAEQFLTVPGMRSSHYLCFFGMHVLTPTIMDILHELLHEDNKEKKITLSDALIVLARKEKYLALEKNDWRYDVGVKYGFLMAQLAISLSGDEKELVLANILELLALRELRNIRR
jgi:UTP--glucose-1-phosphate uridylyltransferase